MSDHAAPPAAARRLQGLADLRALDTFVAVCEANSMTLAAERLGLSQSGVSQTIRALEDSLGLPLMDRDVRPARLTHAGRVLYEQSIPLLQQARSVLDQVRSTARQALAQIRLGCVDSFAATVGPPLIRAMDGRAREIQMWSGLTPTLAAQMLARDLDMVICTEPGVSDARIAQRLLFTEAWVAVFPREQAVSPLLSFKALNEAAGALPLIRYSQRSVIGQQVERWLRHVGVSAPRRYEFDATDPLLSLVASGLGWAISTPLCLWQSRHHLDEVQVCVLPPARLGQRQFYLLSREGEWAGQDLEIARLTREILHMDTLPAIRRRLPALRDDTLSIPSPENPP